MNTYYPSQLFSSQIDSSFAGLYSSNHSYNDAMSGSNNNNNNNNAGNFPGACSGFPGFEMITGSYTHGVKGIDSGRSSGVSSAPHYPPVDSSMQRRLMAKERVVSIGAGGYDTPDDRLGMTSSSMQPSPSQWSPGSATTDESHGHPSSTRQYNASPDQVGTGYRNQGSPVQQTPCIPYYPWMAVVGK